MDTRLPLSTLVGLAKTAGDKFLKDGTNLNITLAKTASDKALLPDQIEYIAAETNKYVWQTLFSEKKAEHYDFPIADPRKIAESLVDKPSTNLSSFDSDYAAPPAFKSTLESELNVKVAEDNSAQEMVKNANVRESREKLEKRAYQLEGKMAHLEMDIPEYELRFVKQACGLLAGQSFDKRAEAYQDLITFMACTGVEKKRCLDLLSKVAYCCTKQGLMEKSAFNEAPEILFDRNVNARVINGNDALYITLKTFDQLESHFVNCKEELAATRDKVQRL